MRKRKVILLTILILIIIGILALILTKSKQISPMQMTATAEYKTTIGETEYDITNAVQEPSEIVPTLSAGMIPIKANGEQWIITTQEDWYDYSNGKPAYIMLNDGYYKSELERGISKNQLASNNVGNDALVVPNVLNNNPTIYMWVPRFAVNEQGEILYIKQGYSVAGSWTLPEIFTYEISNENKADFSLSGVWIEYNPLSNASAVTTKINNMNGENNKYGFIANTKTTGMTTNDQTAIQKYTDKLISKVVGGGSLDDTLNDITNLNRTILKIINTNQQEPIKAKAYYDEKEEKIKLEVNYNINPILKIIDSNGNILSENSNVADTGNEVIGNKSYKYIIIDNESNLKDVSIVVTGLDVYIIENKSDLEFFRDAVNAGKTTAKTKAYQIADVELEGRYTIDEKTGEITFAKDAEEWNPIETTYYGKYYGNNHTISGIYGEYGLFNSCSGAEIKDLGIVNSYIRPYNSDFGSIISYATKNTLLENCYSEAIIDGSAYWKSIGGLVGGTSINSQEIQLTINNCCNKGKIIITSNQVYLGGIIGRAGNVQIYNCYNSGEIVANNSNDTTQVGGIVGRIDNGDIVNCYNVNNITATLGEVGGIAGASYEYVDNCYNIGNISGGNVGGIVGYCSGMLKNSYNIGNISGSNVGGITEYISDGDLENCYNTGIVTGTGYVGAICAQRDRWGRIKECYYEEGTASVSVEDGGTGGTTEVTKGNMPTILSVINSENLFIEDTENINNGYPILAWQVEAAK